MILMDVTNPNTVLLSIYISIVAEELIVANDMNAANILQKKRKL
jgi:hypothetical protein